MSNCRKCGQQVSWVRRPAGNGWWPPFEYNEHLEANEFLVYFDAKLGDIIAQPTDIPNALKAKRHICPVAPVESDPIEAPADTDNPRKSVTYPVLTSRPEPIRLYNEKDWQFQSFDMLELKGTLAEAKLVIDAQERHIASLNSKLHDHDRQIATAKRLANPCPKCLSISFEWCTYMANSGQETIQLHRERV